MSSSPQPPKLPRITPPQPITITTEALTPESFAPFGTAILSPLPQHLRSVPLHPPPPLHPPHQPSPQPANQNTALKTSPVSPLTNNYPSSSPSHGQMSIFSCFPRSNTHLDPTTGHLILDISILERHPYTTQTFCPFNFSSSSSPSPSPSPSSSLLPSSQRRKTYFLVVVAPTSTTSSTTNPRNPPDLSRIRAFIAPVVPEGGLSMAVTYAPGTWHAPMVVLGDRRVDFLVTQFVNGVAEDDCQEVLVGEQQQQQEKERRGKGKEEAEAERRKLVRVDLMGLGLGVGSEEDTGLWKAKL